MPYQRSPRGQKYDEAVYQAKATAKARPLQAPASGAEVEQRSANKAKRIKAAKRAAGINVRSSPVSRAPRTLDEDLRAIASRVYGT